MNLQKGINIIESKREYTVYGISSMGEQLSCRLGEIIVDLSDTPKEPFIEIAENNPLKDAPITRENLEALSEWLYGMITSFSYLQAAFIYNNVLGVFLEAIERPNEFLEMLEKWIVDKGYEYTPNTDSILKFAFDETYGSVSLAKYMLGDLMTSSENKKSVKRLTSLLDIDAMGFQHISYSITVLDGELVSVFSFETIISLLIFEISRIIEHNVVVKKCENCGRYFVPENRTDEIYCSRKSPQSWDMTCKEYGTKKLWYERLKQDKAKKMYRNIYMAKQMLVKRNPDIVEYQKSFERYKSESHKWKSDVKTGTRTEDEYIEWLHAVKEKKVL